MRTAEIVVAALLGAVVSVTSARADTYSVNSTADVVDNAPGDGICATAGGACTLRAAVQEANAHAGDDVVSLPSGLYLLTLTGNGEDLAATGDLDVTGGLQVNGAGAATTIVDGLRLDRLFHAKAPFTLRNVTIRRGAESGAGGILIEGPGAATIEGAVFQENLAGTAGALAHVSPDALTITGATFEDNTSGSDGGALAIFGTANLAVADSRFNRNVTFGGDGGAIHGMTTGSVTLTNSTFTGNLGANAAGVLAIGPSSFAATGCTFDGNTAGSAGGALLVITGGAATLTNVTATNNTAMQIAGVLLQGDTAQISGGEISDNLGISAFGGLYVQAANGATIDGMAARRNSGGAGPGGGMYVLAAGGNISISNVETSENSAGIGGGLVVTTGAGDIAMNRVRVLNNGASGGPGGGIYAVSSGALSIVDSTIAGNVAVAPGGGLYAGATGAIGVQGTTIAQNRAATLGGIGGGGLVTSPAASTITNSTVSGNVGDAFAGGLYLIGDWTIRNVSFVDNDSPVGSALMNGGTANLVSTIIAGSAADHCGPVPVTSGGGNIDSNGSCALAGPGDTTIDPQLGPLADNGGPTQTHSPVTGSPAIDGGAAAGCPATDQRGETRPTDGNGDGASACDVGAVEFLDLCPTDPAKVLPGICGCGVADSDTAQPNGTADCLVNGELKARIARGKAIIAALAGEADPAEPELGMIGASLPEYLTQFAGQVGMSAPDKKVKKLAKKAAKMIKKIMKAKGKKLEKAKTKAMKSLDAFDAVIAPQA